MNIEKITDDQQIAFVGRMIYQTDPYIYPALFAEENNAVKVIRELLNISGDIFCRNNIYIAKDSCKNIGMICAYTKKFDSLYENWLTAFVRSGAVIPETFHKAYFSYIHKLSLERNNGIYISNICIDEKFRNKGFGLKILRTFIEMQHDVIVYLDVLKENAHALNLYHQVGFKITEEYDGFSLSKDKPRCYHMMKYIN